MRLAAKRFAMTAALLAGGSFLLAGNGCITFLGESALSAGDFCFVFDCQNGILGGTIDPCATSNDSEGNALPPLFVDCPDEE